MPVLSLRNASSSLCFKLPRLDPAPPIWAQKFLIINDPEIAESHTLIIAGNCRIRLKFQIKFAPAAASFPLYPDLPRSIAAAR